MSDTSKRLRASIQHEAHHGNDAERSVCGRQMIEAANLIDRLEREAGESANDARDAARYRWLRSEDTATNPLYCPFWQKFNVKFCREEAMDAVLEITRAGD